MSMSELWNISVSGRVYGPYTHDQMRTFANEGRLAPQSLVAHPGQENFRDASEEPELAALFRPSKPGAMAEIMEDQAPTFGRHSDETGEASHLVIMADMKSRSISGLEEEIYNLGPAVNIMPQAWAVKSDLPVNVVRNMLQQKLGKLDTLFIVDATHDKASWFNFAPEADTKLRRLWVKIPDRKTA
jgi:hypothetical protein